MNEKETYNLLEFILKRLEGIEFKWRLDGSVNLLVQGIDLNPNDLDIATTDNGLEVFFAHFNEFVVAGESGKFEGRILILDIDGKEIEINYYQDSDLQMMNKIELIEWRGLQLPILPLKEAKKFYEKIERKEKVKILTESLKISRERDK